jgi:hypothetical protein
MRRPLSRDHLRRLNPTVRMQIVWIPRVQAVTQQNQLPGTAAAYWGEMIAAYRISNSLSTEITK